MTKCFGSSCIAALCAVVGATACNDTSVLAGETSCVAFAPEVVGEFGPIDNRPPASPWARSGDLVVGTAGTLLLLFDVSTRSEPVRLSQLELNGDALQVEFVSASADQLLVAVAKLPELDARVLPTPETRRPVDTLLRVDVSDPVSPRIVSERPLAGRLWQFRQTTAALWVLEGIPERSQCDFDDTIPNYPTFELSSFRADNTGFAEIDRVELRGKTLGWLNDNAAFASTQLHPYGSADGALSYARFGADGTIAAHGELTIDGTVVALSMGSTDVRTVITAERSLVLRRTPITPQGTSSTTTVGTAEFNGRLRASFVGDWLFVSSTDGNGAARVFRLTEDAVEEVDALHQAHEVRPLQGLHPRGDVEPVPYALARRGTALSVLKVTDTDISVLDDFVVPGVSAPAAFDGMLADGSYLVAVERDSGTVAYQAFDVSADRIDEVGSTSAPIGNQYALGDVLIGGDAGFSRTWLHAWEPDKTSGLATAAPFQLAVAAGRIATVRREGDASVRVLAIADRENPNEPLWETEVPEHHELLGAGDFFVGVSYESQRPRARVFSAPGKPRLVSDLAVPEDLLGRPSKHTDWHGEGPAALPDNSVVFEAKQSGENRTLVAHYPLHLTESGAAFGEAVWGNTAIDGDSRWDLMLFGDRLIATRVEHVERAGHACSHRVFGELIGQSSDGALHSSEPFAVKGRPVAMATPQMDHGAPVLLSVEPVARNTNQAQLHRARVGPVGAASLDTLVLDGHHEDVRVVGSHAVVLSRSEQSCEEPRTLAAIHVAGQLREVSTLELPPDRWTLVGNDDSSVLLQAGFAPRTFAKVTVADDGTLRHASTKTAHCSHLPLEDGQDLLFADGTLTCLTANGVERVRF